MLQFLGKFQAGISTIFKMHVLSPILLTYLFDKLYHKTCRRSYSSKKGINQGNCMKFVCFKYLYFLNIKAKGEIPFALRKECFHAASKGKKYPTYLTFSEKRAIGVRMVRDALAGSSPRTDTLRAFLDGFKIKSLLF